MTSTGVGPEIEQQTEPPILGFDPGRDKCGLALVQRDGQPRHRQVVPSASVLQIVHQWAQLHGLTQVILGDQTSSRHWHDQLQQALPQCSITLIDERNSSLEARQRYWDYHPPRGWNWLLPKGLRTPPTPYDDIVAQILVERYLEQQHGS